MVKEHLNLVGLLAMLNALKTKRQRRQLGALCRELDQLNSASAEVEEAKLRLQTWKPNPHRAASTNSFIHRGLGPRLVTLQRVKEVHRKTAENLCDNISGGSWHLEFDEPAKRWKVMRYAYTANGGILPSVEVNPKTGSDA